MTEKKEKKIPEKVTVAVNELHIADFKTFQFNVAPLSIVVPKNYEFTVASLSIAKKQNFEFEVGAHEQRRNE